MKIIILTKGYTALVDDEDYEYINQWKWFARKRNHTIYAERCAYLGGGRSNSLRKSIMMHRVIMNAPGDLIIDHVDHNGLNNQKSNLRLCTDMQNAQNVTPSGKSKYLGVTIRHTGRQAGQIAAQIQYNKRKIHLGIFLSEETAAIAYDKKAKELFGEFANLNFKNNN